MSKNAMNNLPSSTTKDNAFGGERGGAMELIDDGTTFFTNDVEDMLDLTRLNSGVVNEDDINAIISKTKDLLDKKKSESEVNKMYTRYQNLWTDFCAKNGVKDEYNDVALVQFFKSLHGRYAPSTKWVIYSCINSRIIDVYGCNLKNLPRLRKYLKLETQLYVAKKSKTYDAKEMHHVLTVLQDSNNPKHTVQGVAIALLYYGLLRINEVKKLTVDDITLKSNPKEIEIVYYHARKKRNEGFTYNVPVTFYDMFEKYIKQLCPDVIKSGMRQFLKNWNGRAKRRIQNMGKNNLNKLQKVACTILKKNDIGYTSHCWRRSAATNLADAGVSFINLKRHGQWVSDSVVEGYIANSKPLREERLHCLLPAEIAEEEKSKKEVGQLTIKNGKNNMIENYDSFVNLSNLPLDSNVNQEGSLTLYGFSQFDDPNLRIEYQDSTEDGIPLMKASLCNMEPAPVQKMGSESTNAKSEIAQLLQSNATFTNCTFVFNSK